MYTTSAVIPKQQVGEGLGRQQVVAVDLPAHQRHWRPRRNGLGRGIEGPHIISYIITRYTIL